MFRKFPSIEQFSTVVKQVRMRANHKQVSLPTITYEGTVKLHGTNSCIGYNYKTGELFTQSRERILSYESDNAGFYVWVMSNKDAWINAFKSVGIFGGEISYIYGEFACGNIQKGVALSQIDEKQFFVFDVVTVTDSTEIHEHQEYINLVLTNVNLHNVHYIKDVAQSYYITIDFNDPSAVQNTLLELTMAVEAECPVGKYFGVIGVGEGIVWKQLDADELFRDLSMFKVKGEAHSSTKVKTIKELSAAEIAQKESAKEFVDYALTDNRLIQGWTKLEELGHPQDVTSMGVFLKWIATDIIKECEDVLTASLLDRKVVMKPINEQAKGWFMKKVNE